MSSTRTNSSFLVLMLFSTTAVLAQQQPLRTGVRKVKEPVSSKSYDGVVNRIDADELVLIEKRDDHKPVTHKLVPIDLLRDGKYVIDYHDGKSAYRWSDVKAGDTVRLETLKDDGDGLTYCLQISIRRRPEGKLPASQYPEKDRWYDNHRLLNEIENGNDVSDAEMLKVWPPEFDPVTKKQTPGGLYTGKYKEMLDANRKRIAEEKEKKAAELKAKPVADKVEPKKADKK